MIVEEATEYYCKLYREEENNTEELKITEI